METTLIGLGLAALVGLPIAAALTGTPLLALGALAGLALLAVADAW